MAFASGSWTTVFIGATILSNTVATFNHALGTTPMVQYCPTALAALNLSTATNAPVLVSRTTSFVGLFNQSASTWIGDVRCDSVHSIVQ
jgi:hypothetical protein